MCILNYIVCFLMIFQVILTLGQTQDVPAVHQQTMVNNNETKMSDYVLSILKHYEQEVPEGIPGAPIPDPLDIPNLAPSSSFGRMQCTNVKLYGLKKFQIDYVNADIKAMKVEAALKIKTIIVRGNYSLSTLFSTKKGPFTVTLTDVYATTVASLAVERNGSLEAQDMNMDIKFKNINLDFKNLGMLQSVISSMGSFIFDSIKPFVISEMNTNVRKEVNGNVRKLGLTFPNSISPFDQLLANVREKIRNAKFDPYKIEDYNKSVGIFDCYLTNTWVYGLSSIHRVGDINIKVHNNTITALFQIGTQKLKGRTNWEVSLVSKILSQTGIVSFSINYLNIQVELKQSMDTRKSPQIENIELELGNIQIRFNGAGTMDYIIEFAVNIIPNLLRYQVMDALEGPVKYQIQREFDKMNIQQLVKENREMIDNPKSVQLF